MTRAARTAENLLVVGRVDPHAVRIWFRAARPGRFDITWEPAASGASAARDQVSIPPDNDRDNTCSVRLGERGLGEKALLANHPYSVRVSRSDTGAVIASGCFRTAPEPSSDLDGFSFLIGSCHQPFGTEGDIDPDARDMLTAVNVLRETRDVRFFLAMGDQMYTDYPARLSLLNESYFARIAPHGKTGLKECTATEVRDILHRRYRQWWASPEWQELVSHVPSYPMWDDHEIVDNWGSAKDHVEPSFQNLFEGARAAYRDYQGTWIAADRDVVDDFDFQFEFGPTATYGLDLRTYRTPGDHGRICSDEQWDRLRTFFRAYQHKEILFLVLSVPLVHLPRTAARWIARASSLNEDFSDRWSTLGHLRDRDRFLELLNAHQRTHPEQKIILLSGDIHLACAHRVSWPASTRGFYQFVSSGLTQRVGFWAGLAACWSIRINRGIREEGGRLSASVEPLESRGDRRTNPFAGRNCGIVELSRPPGGGRLRARYSIHTHEGDRPHCVYASPYA